MGKVALVGGCLYGGNMQNFTATQSIVVDDLNSGYEDGEQILTLDDLYATLVNLFVLPGENPGIGGYEIEIDPEDPQIGEAYADVLIEARAWETSAV